jgi:hypothetical protein
MDDDVIMQIEREAEREIKQLETRLHDATARAERAEAELEAARPLIRAANDAVLLKTTKWTVGGKAIHGKTLNIESERAMCEAVVAYRESQGPKEG